MKKIQLDLQTEAVIGEILGELKGLPRVKGGKIRQVPVALQEKIVGIFRAGGLAAEDFSSRLGSEITGQTIRTWAKRKRGPVRKAKKTTFSEVKIKPEAKLTAPRVGLTLELAGGARVHGLSLMEIRELVMSEGAR